MIGDTPEDPRCTECGSSAVLEADTIGLHCVECGNEWLTSETSAYELAGWRLAKVIGAITFATFALFVGPMAYVTYHVHRGTTPQGIKPEVWNAFVQDPIGVLYAGEVFPPDLILSVLGLLLLNLWIIFYLMGRRSITTIREMPPEKREWAREELEEVETEQREGGK